MQIEVTPAARADLVRITLFNLERSQAWAEKVQQRLDGAMLKVFSTRQLGRSVRGATYKRFSVTDIHYVIDYERLEDGIRVLRIRHAREVR